MSTSKLSRDEKVENLVLNLSMIMMGIFEGVFASLATGMATAMNQTAEAITTAFEGDGKDLGGKKPSTNLISESEMNGKFKEIFSGLRKEVAEGFSDKDQSFKEFLNNPAFDDGVKIVERHSLKIPALTEKLGDSDLASYMSLIQNGDPEVESLMKELGEWQQTAPTFRK